MATSSITTPRGRATSLPRRAQPLCCCLDPGLQVKSEHGFVGCCGQASGRASARAVHVRARAARALLKTARQVFTLHVSRPAIEPSSIRSALALQGQALSDVAAVGDILAEETQSPGTKFWLAQVTGRACHVPERFKCPVAASSGVIFEFTRNKPAVKVRHLKPITVARGANSTRIYEIDEKLPPFFVPGHLACMGYIRTTYCQAPPQRRGRSSVIVPGKGWPI